MLPFNVIAAACSSGDLAAEWPQLPGQVFDFDPSGDDPSLIDEVGGEIDVCRDAAGGAVTLTAASAGQRPAYSANLNGHRGAVLSFTDSTLLSSTTGGCATGGASHAVFVLCSQVANTVTSTYESVARFGNTASGQQSGLFEYGYVTDHHLLAISLVLEPQSLTYGTDPTHFYGRTAVYASSTPIVLGKTYHGTEERLWIDGEVFKEQLSQTALSTVGPSIHLGGPVNASGPASNANVWRAAFAAGAALDDHEASLPGIDAWHAAVATRFGLWKPVRILGMGHSLMYGQKPVTGLSTDGALGYIAANGSVNGGDADTMNAGVSAHLLSDTLTRVHNVATMRFSAMRRAGPNKPGNVLVIWAASNSLATDDGATAYAALLSIIAEPRARGYKVVVCTEIWRGDFNGTQDGYRLDYNTLVRAGAGVDFDACCDLAANVAFQSDTSSYYEGTDHDGIHLCDGDATKGYGLAGELIAATVNSVIA